MLTEGSRAASQAGVARHRPQNATAHSPASWGSVRLLGCGAREEGRCLCASTIPEGLQRQGTGRLRHSSGHGACSGADVKAETLREADTFLTRHCGRWPSVPAWGRWLGPSPPGRPPGPTPRNAFSRTSKFGGKIYFSVAERLCLVVTDKNFHRLPRTDVAADGPGARFPFRLRKGRAPHTRSSWAGVLFLAYGKLKEFVVFFQILNM